MQSLRRRLDRLEAASGGNCGGLILLINPTPEEVERAEVTAKGTGALVRCVTFVGTKP